MNRERSWTRQQYEHCFRTLRRETYNSAIPSFVGIHADIINAADYSYLAAFSTVQGWISNQRRQRFLAIKWRVLSREELPF